MECSICGSDDCVMFDELQMENEDGEYVVEYYECKNCGYEWEEVK